MSGTRIVLVKPGDVLIFGNVTVDLEDPHLGKAMTELKERVGLAQVLVFEDDIDLAVQRGSSDGPS